MTIDEDAMIQGVALYAAMAFQPSWNARRGTTKNDCETSGREGTR